MPIFEFQCTVCGHIVEKIYKSVEEAPEYIMTKCCHNAINKRIISVPGYRRDQTLLGD